MLKIRRLVMTDFLVGGLAGAGATVFTNPMDVVKTRLQLQGELVAKKDVIKQYRNVGHAMYVIIKTDGALALQKGLVSAMLLGFVLNAVRLGTFKIVELNNWTRDSSGRVVFYKTAFWSTVAGYLSGLAANPIYVVKTRLQAESHPSIAVGRQHAYKGMSDAFTTIYRCEGIKGFYAGLNATGWRMSLGSCVQLTTFTQAKEIIQNKGFCAESPMALAFFASCMSGVALALLICPFDVTCTRLYNQGNIIWLLGAKDWLSSNGIGEHSPVLVPFVASLLCSIPLFCTELPIDVINTRLVNQGSKELLYTSIFDAISKIWKTEGLNGFYKGIGPYYFRAAPHTTLSLMIWDFLNDFLYRKKV